MKQVLVHVVPTLAWFAMSLFFDYAGNHITSLANFAAFNVLFSWGSYYASSHDNHKRIDELQAEIRRLAALLSRDEPETGIFVKQNSN